MSRSAQQACLEKYHHAEIIALEGDSYRRRVAEARRKPPRPAADG
jgi:hypothetical protein